MKYFLLFFIAVASFSAEAQKFALLDQRLVQPIKYVNSVTSEDKFNNLLPVERKDLPEFIKALKEIEAKLSSQKTFDDLKQYEIGCVKFTGRTVSLSTGQRMDYVITSTCDNIKISMHLSNVKSSNARNDFFIKTWIKYIEDNLK